MRCTNSDGTSGTTRTAPSIIQWIVVFGGILDILNRMAHLENIASDTT